MFQAIDSTYSRQNSSQIQEEPINLFKLGMLYTIKCRYWTARATNEAEELDLTQDRIDARALASFGTKDLIDPVKSRKVFQQIEKRARHIVEKCSRPFGAANAHFVPWGKVADVTAQLEELRQEFEEAVREFMEAYPRLRRQWQELHPEIPNCCYPSEVELRGKFSLAWHTFRVSGAPELTPVEDIEMALEERRLRDEQTLQMEAGLRAECERFVEGYVLSFRREVAHFCDQVIMKKGQVHGKTLNAIRDRIDRFHQMNVFGDSDAATRLAWLKQQITSVTGQDLVNRPAVANSLREACQALKNAILNPGNVNELTGRLKRRIILG